MFEPGRRARHLGPRVSPVIGGLGCEQLVDVIECRDYFTTSDQLFEVIALGQLIVF